MKKFIFLYLSFITLTATAQTVNIPNSIFLKILLQKGVDINNDGIIQNTEAEKVENLYLSDNSITDLTGIEAFTSLRYLLCTFNPITKIDISKNVLLETLVCSRNQIRNLDISKNINLHTLNCNYNQITSLDISNNLALTNLYCSGNKINSLDVSKNKNLIQLWCGENFITKIDLTNNDSLKHLDIRNSPVNSIDFPTNSILEHLYYSDCNMPSLDISKNTLLKELFCENNQISNLDISNNKILTRLYCGHNLLTKIDFSNNSLLNTFYGNNNLFKTFNFNGITGFENFNCAFNKLTELNISKTDIEYMSCYANPELFQICINSKQLPQTWAADDDKTPFWTKDNHTLYKVDCGNVSIPKIEKSIVAPTLLNIYNLLGQEVSPEQLKEGVYIYRYSDGSVKRIWNTGSD